MSPLSIAQRRFSAIAAAALLCAAALASGCGPSVHALQQQAMQRSLESLNRQVHESNRRREALASRVTLLAGRVETLKAQLTQQEPAARREPQPPSLEIVTLQPPETAAGPEAGDPLPFSPKQERHSEAVVEITLRGESDDSVEPLAVTKVASPPRHLTSRRTRSPEAEQAFTRALQLFGTGDTDEAQRLWRAFIARYPQDPQVPRAHYWIGVANFERGKFRSAAQAFTQLFDNFPEDEKAAEALFKAGLAYERLGETGLAHRAFKQLVSRYPSSAVAELGQRRLAAPVNPHGGA